MLITSKSNELVKKIKKLGDKKYRAEYGEYVAEGRRWVTDARQICPQNVLTVISSQSCNYEYADVLLADNVFNEITDTQNSQGVLAVMKIPPLPSEINGDYCLFLDGVRDPGNMGTLIRTACAAGYKDIVLHNCVDVYNGKVIRSSMTGILGVNIHYCNDFTQIKRSGYTVYAAALDGQNVFDCKFGAQKACLVIGSEANGISKELLDCCDCRLTVPMQQGIESLNAAVSAAVLMYQLKYNKEK